MKYKQSQGPTRLSEITKPRAILISDASRLGSAELAQRLSGIFTLTTVQPVFVSETLVREGSLVDEQAFLARHLRPPTLGEIGCAIAHRNAQSLFLRSQDAWAVIFEDDARVINLEQLESRMPHLTHILSSPEPTVINLNANAVPTRLSRSSSNSSGIRAPFTPTYTSTAYALNRAAAELFVNAQSPIRSQADWPKTKERVNHFFDPLTSVEEDMNLVSRIDKHGSRKRVTSSAKIKMWSGIWYLKYKNQIPSLSCYWQWLLRPRLIIHLDSLLRRLTQRSL